MPLYLTILRAGLRASVHNGAGVLSGPQASIRRPSDRLGSGGYNTSSSIVQTAPERRIPIRVFWELNRRMYEE